MIRGYRKALVFTDLYKPKKDDRSEEILPRFEQEWHKRINKTGWQ